jgi:hypothetical protein
VAVRTGKLRPDKETKMIVRLGLITLFSYVAYRIGRELIASVPSDFEPIPLLPPPAKRARKKVQRSSEAGLP